MEDRRDLFPLSVVGAKGVVGCRNNKSSRARARAGKRAQISESVRAMCCSLNYLHRDDPYYVRALNRGWPSSKTPRSHTAQESVLGYLKERSLEAWRRGLFEPCESAEGLDLGAYAPEVGIKEPLMLDPRGDIVSLPKKGLAASVDMVSKLPLPLRDLYSGPALLREPSADELLSTKRCLMVKDGEYPELINKLVEVGCVRLGKDRPIEINGLFGVEKDGGASQRLILDARRANLHFILPEDPNLPHPGVVTQLQKDSNEPLVAAKVDVDNFYHRLRLPEHLQTYFGLPPVLIKGTLYWPRMVSVPMGWSHSVFVTQKIVEHLLFDEGEIDRKLEINMGSARKDLRCRIGRYIDDIFILGWDKNKVRRTYDRVYSCLARHGLPPKPKKCQEPTTDPVEVLGLELRSNGCIEVQASKMKKLIGFTRALLRQHVWSVHTLQRLLGSWNWFLLLNRPIMSVIQKCYDLSCSKKRAIVAHNHAKNELRSLLSLVPLLHANLAGNQTPYMLCSDASLSGGAALYSEHIDWHRTQTHIYTNKADAVSYTSSIPNVKWKRIAQVHWKYKKHINVLEGLALLIGIRWLGRQKCMRGGQVSVLTDSQVLFYMIKKGRSGASRLVRISQRIGALSVALNMRLDPVWVPSKDNPADAPSRE